MFLGVEYKRNGVDFWKLLRAANSSNCKDAIVHLTMIAGKEKLIRDSSPFSFSIVFYCKLILAHIGNLGHLEREYPVEIKEESDTTLSNELSPAKPGKGSRVNQHVVKTACCLEAHPWDERNSKSGKLKFSTDCI